MEWQPIETAPLDGTPLLGYSHKGYGAFKWDAVDWDDCPGGKTHYWWTGVDDDMWIEDPFDVPTHWMPLPEPPLTEPQ